MKPLQTFLIAINVIIFILIPAKLNAHALEQSYIFLTINHDSIEGRVEINIPDLNQALSLNLATDKSVTSEDIRPHLKKIKEYFQQRVKIGLQQGLILDNYFLHSIPKVQYLAFPFIFKSLPEIPSSIDFSYGVLFDIEPEHRGFVVIENDWRSGTFDDEGNIALIFSPDDAQKTLDLSGSTVMQGYVEMVKLGVHHIWEGIDHILFLIALLLPAVMFRHNGQWQAVSSFYPAFINVVKIVTIFTVAHTITLSAATLSVVSLPSRLVESIIALSIAVAALDTLYPIFRGKLWLVIFVFGLFHGFGFASVLSDYNIPGGYLTGSLLAFNLGVELGQIAIVAVVFPVLFVLSKSRYYLTLGLQFGSLVLIVIALYWFIERGFEIDLPAGSALNWLLAFVGLR